MKNLKDKVIFIFLLLIIFSVLSKNVLAVANLRNIIVTPNCGPAGTPITIYFEVTDEAWMTTNYAVAFSADTTLNPDPVDIYIAGGSSGSCPNSGATGPTQGGTPTWLPVTVTANVPSGIWNYIIVIIKSAPLWDCIGDAQGYVSFSITCGTPTLTPTISPTATSGSTFADCNKKQFMGACSTGESNVDLNGTMIAASQYQLHEDGEIAALSAYINSSSGGNIRLAMYDDASGVPGNLLFQVGPQASTAGWNTINLNSNFALPKGRYWIAVQVSAAGDPVLNYDTTMGGPGYTASYSEGPFPNSFPSGTSNTNSYSLSAVYCPAYSWVGYQTAMENGRLARLDASGEKIAMRFTQPETKTINAIWTYVNIDSTSPQYRIGIQAASGNLPSGTFLTSGLITPADGWISCAVTNYTLNPGDYFVVIEPSGNPSLTRYSEWREGNTPGWRKQPTDNFYDDKFYAFSNLGLGWNPDSSHPCMVLQYTDSSSRGNPYHAMAALALHNNNTPGDESDDRMAMQIFVPGPGGWRVDRIGAYVYASTSNPGGSLDYLIYDEVAKVTMTAGTLAGTSGAPVTTTGTWLETDLPAILSLEEGKIYKVIFYSHGSPSTNRWHLLAGQTTSGTSALQKATWQGESAYAGFSTNNGLSYTNYLNYDALVRLKYIGPASEPTATMTITLTPTPEGTNCTVVLDTGFNGLGYVSHEINAGMGDYGYAVDIDSAGRIIVAGYTYTGASNDIAIWRYLGNGQRDTGGFNSPFGYVTHNGGAGGGGAAHDIGNDVIIGQADSIWVAGQSYNSEPTVNYDMCVWKYRADGTLDTSFSGDGILSHGGGAGGLQVAEAGNGIAMDGSGMVIVAGYGLNGTNNDMILWKFDQGGNWDINFGGGDGVLSSNLGNAEIGYAVVTDSNNNIYVVGTSNSTGNYDMIVWKYDRFGNPVTTDGWGPNGYIRHDSTCGVASSDDRGFDIKIDKTGKLVIGGISNCGAGTYVAVWKIDAITGNIEFYDTYKIATGTYNDSAQGIYVDNRNRIILTGWTEVYLDELTYDLSLYRWNGDGIRDLTFGGGQFYITHNGAAGDGDGDRGYEVAVNKNIGEIYVGGAGDANPASGSTSYDMVIWKYKDECGESLDTPTMTMIPTITETSTPAATATGTCIQLDPAFDLDGVVLYNFDGWGNGPEEGNAITFDGNQILIAGARPGGAMEYYDLVVWRYNSDGTQDTSLNSPIGVILFNGAASRDDGATAVKVDRSGRYVVCGMTYNGTNFDMIVLRYLSNGTIDTTFNGTGYRIENGTAGGNGNDFGFDLAIDRDGKIIVVGESANMKPDADMVLWKYNENGTRDITFGGTGYIVYDRGFGEDTARAVAIDNNNKILVTGRTTGNVTQYDMTIWRFNADGTLDNTFNGTGIRIVDIGNEEQTGYGIKIDGMNRIVVAGNSWVDSGIKHSDLAVWRFMSDGSPDLSFNVGLVLFDTGGMMRNEWGEGIEIDRNGNIVVTGHLEGLLNEDMVIWRIKENGTMDNTFEGGYVIYEGGGDDSARRVAIDEQNRILTTGRSYNVVSGTNMDMAIWRYVDKCTIFNTPTDTPTMKPSFVMTYTITGTVTETVTLTITSSLTPSVTQTVTPTVTPTYTRTVTETVTPTATETVTETSTPTVTSTSTSSDTPTGIPTATPSVTPTVTEIMPPTITETITGTVTETITSSNTPTNSVTATNTETITETNTPSVTETITPSMTPTVTETITETITSSNTPTNSVTATNTETITPTITETVTETITQTNTPSPTDTYTVSSTVTPTETPTNSATGTNTPTITYSSTQTRTASPTDTITETRTSTPSDTPTSTYTNTPTDTDTLTWTPTGTSTPTDTDTPTNTATPTYTLTNTSTMTGTETWTNTPSITLTQTFTMTGTDTPTYTTTKTPTLTHSPTPNIAIALDKNYINPEQGEQVKIRVRSDRVGEEIRFKVYNLTGELIRKWEGVIYVSGWNEYYWNGKNDANNFAGKGIYFIYITIKDTEREVRRIYVIK